MGISLSFIQMNKQVFCLILLIFVEIVGCENLSEKNGRIGNITAVDSLLQNAIDKEHISGAVIRIQQGDSIWHYKAYGYAQKYSYGMEPLDAPVLMTKEHVFDLASLTKVFATTYGIMLLADREKLGLDDPAHTYLPELNKNEKRNITIRHFLTHSSGLPQWYPLYYKASNKEERFKQIIELPLKWPVGEGRHYSDLGFMLLGDIIEKATGKLLDQFLTDELYRILNLQHTTFKPLKKNLKNIAATSHGNPFEKHMVHDDDFGYNVDVEPESWNGWREYTLKGEVNDGNAWYANNGVAGHAGLFSTAEDLQVLVSLLLNKGDYNGKRIISEAVIDTFLTKDKYGNGLGWAMDPNIISAKGTPGGTFGHTGFTGTNVVVIPEYDLSVIFLTNRQNVGLQEDGYYYNLGPLRQQIVDGVMKRVSDK